MRTPTAAPIAIPAYAPVGRPEEEVTPLLPPVPAEPVPPDGDIVALVLVRDVLVDTKGLLVLVALEAALDARGILGVLFGDDDPIQDVVSVSAATRMPELPPDWPLASITKNTTD